LRGIFRRRSGKLRRSRAASVPSVTLFGAHVDHGGAGFDPIGLNVTGPADGGDENVGAANHFGEIARFRMANRDRGVGVEQKQRHGFADNVAAAEDDGICALDWNFVAAKHFHAAGGVQATSPGDC